MGGVFYDVEVNVTGVEGFLLAKARRRTGAERKRTGTTSWICSTANNRRIPGRYEATAPSAKSMRRCAQPTIFSAVERFTSITP